MGGVVLERLSAATDGRTGGVRADGRVYYREREYFSLIVMEMKWIASIRILIRNKGYMRAQRA